MSRDRDELSCREFIDFILAYLEGDLDAPVRRIFEQHIEACPPCLDYLASYRETVALTAEACASDDAVPADVPEGLVRAVLDARRGS